MGEAGGAIGRVEVVYRPLVPSIDVLGSSGCLVGCDETRIMGFRVRCDIYPCDEATLVRKPPSRTCSIYCTCETACTSHIDRGLR